ncbi:hypothetical protein [Longimicrobium sp.]|uniref:glycine-rich domain-containing protein n=1 Tax=Longimicrobium sp. TaxID=2029185 RepID=UPI002E3234A2|nr:hypothetical protein [Longimicrobium sp.]HEX6040510.1 hypothetical protein [Longimicrobium sp.]
MSTLPTAGYPHDPPLRARIQAFSPDEPGVVFPFSARLARENGWTRAFAQRVMEEYRRFVYLAMTAGHPVTPSVEVDQAWHLHLTCTRSYWEEMCGRVLGRPLHHDPTRGGRAESDKFVDWYARTLDSYRRAFGHAPPTDVWPSPAERFAPAGRIRQVSDATHWVLRKPRLPRRLAAAVAIGALLTVAACTAGEVQPQTFLTVAVLAAVFGGAVLSSARRGTSRGAPAARRRGSSAFGRRGSAAGGTGYGGSGWDGGDSDPGWGGGGGHCADGGGGDCGDGGGGDGGGGCGGGCGGCGG